MSQWKPLGLIASGRMSSSLLMRRPALSRHIGPVVALDRRLATRYSNSLRAGSAAPVEDLHACGLVLVHSDAAGLERLLPLLLAAGPWKGARFALISQHLDSSALGALRSSGARVCSVATAPARARDLAVVEGDAKATALAKLWLQEGHLRCFELAPGRRGLFQLGLFASQELLGPIFEAALASLRASGLSAIEARRLLFEAAESSLRAFAARGRKALDDPLAQCRSGLLLRGLEDAARSRPAAASFLADVIEAVARLYAAPQMGPAPEDSRVPGRAAGIS